MPGDPESSFRKTLAKSSKQVQDSFEKLSQLIRSLDPAVFPYPTGLPDIRYTTSDVPPASKGYHPFTHISGERNKLIVHLKDVDDPRHITRPRSNSEAVMKKYYRSLPRQTFVGNPDQVDDYLGRLLKQSLFILRKEYL